MVTKQLWRIWAQSQRRRFDERLIRDGIARYLNSLDDPAVLTYSSMPGEPDVEPIEGAGRLLLTRTPDTGGLTIHTANSPRETHRWGYSQPVGGSVEIDPFEIDVVLVPGALFDRRGGRLGHGRGYYDRLLATCRSDVVMVGVTSLGALVERLPLEPHDIRMTHLATEAGVRPVQSPRSS